ncbi:MAG: SDR family oxidoreductase [Archangium sp.]|nr:SDR family oxidoreductase [Archangium sp.]
MSTNNSRIAVITGGSRGLGRSMAEALAAKGVDVVFTFHSNEAEAKAVVKSIEGQGRKAVALKLDLRQSAGFSAFADQVKDVLKKQFDRTHFDILVNNAGTGMYAAFAETTEAQFDEMFNVHLKSTFFLSQKLLPLIVDGGRIMNVSTGLARFSLPGYAAYGTMKGGVETLTRYMARELAGRKIAVNVLAPGAIETDFGGGRVRDDKATNQYVASMIAMGRVGLPQDIGPAVAALVSPELGWMTAQRIELSGGTLI